MRVLTVTNMYPQPSAPAHGVFVKDQVRSLRNAGIETDVIVIDGRTSRANYLFGIRKLRGALRKSPWDLIHAHYGLTGWMARFQVRAPMVITFHGDDINGTPGAWLGRTTSLMIAAASRVLQPLSDATIVVSEQMRRRLWFEGLRPNVHVIPCGVDTEHFRPLAREDALKRVGLDATRRYIIFPSNPEGRNKRLDIAEAAVAIVRRRYPNVELLVVHNKPYALMPAFFNVSDALVLTSEAEGSPMVVKEALACDVPVVAVRVGDVEERIGGLPGCHLCARDPEPIARALESVLQGPRPVGIRDAVKNLDSAVIAGRVVGVYERVLARRAVRREGMRS